jgi:transcriptional antiterminator RfaH
VNQVPSFRQLDDADDGMVWLLAQAKPNMLPRAHRHLENQGFRVFVPQIQTTNRVNGQFRDKRAPLFPGYLFVQVDPETGPWRKINSTYGVSRLVSFTSNRPAIVPSDLITDLRSRFSAELDLPPEDRLDPGIEVEVIKGPFAGLTARIAESAPNDRIWLLLDIMGRETRVSADKRNVIKV